MTDFLYDTNGDLLIDSTGDWATGDSTEDEVTDILISYPGWWKEFPLVGVGLPSWLGSPGNGQQLANDIRLQLQMDGKQLQSFTYSMVNGVLTVNVNGIEVSIS